MPWTPAIAAMLSERGPSKKASGRAQQTAAHRKRRRNRKR